jgi:hypothetical protein
VIAHGLGGLAHGYAGSHGSQGGHGFGGSMPQKNVASLRYKSSLPISAFFASWGFDFPNLSEE